MESWFSTLMNSKLANLSTLNVVFSPGAVRNEIPSYFILCSSSHEGKKTTACVGALHQDLANAAWFCLSAGKWFESQLLNYQKFILKQSWRGFGEDFQSTPFYHGGGKHIIPLVRCSEWKLGGRRH